MCLRNVGSITDVDVRDCVFIESYNTGEKVVSSPRKVPLILDGYQRNLERACEIWVESLI